MWELWGELVPDVGTARARVSNYVPWVRPIRHQSLPEMFIIALMRSLILRRERERKKFPDLCLHCYPFLSSFMKTKFQWIPAVLTLSSYEVKLSLTLHNSTGRPQSTHGYCAVSCDFTVRLCHCHISGVKEPEHKLTNWPWQLTHFISLAAFFFFFFLLQSIHSQCSRAPSQLDCYHKGTKLVEHLPVFFRGALFNFELKLTSRPHHSVFFTGKQEKGGESEDVRGRKTGTFWNGEFMWSVAWFKNKAQWEVKFFH